MRRALTLWFVLLLCACEEDPPPSSPDAGGALDLGKAVGGADVASPDAAWLDAMLPDSGVDTGAAPDTGVSDHGLDAGMADAGLVDAGAISDGSVGDVGDTDATTVDVGPPDAGPNLTDSDGDGIRDVDEGSGAVDSDGDGTPDSQDLDSDGDGIPDAAESGDANLLTQPIDTDGDGTPDFRDLDADGDTLPDTLEGTTDTDADGRPDYLDLDADGDLIRDDQDGGVDDDGDGVLNFRDLDSDADGLPDRAESGDASLGTPPDDADGDGRPNFLDLDSDGDTVSDADEGLMDTDGDTLADYVDIDSDGDTLFDADEAGDGALATAPIDTDGDGTPDFQDIDSDGDTIRDATEGVNDPDGDMQPNYRDTDADGDTVADADEAGDGDLATLPIDTDRDRSPDYLDLDSDGDGLGDSVESGCPMSTNRLRPDSDADGFPDPAELAYGSNPCNFASVIDDFYFVLSPGVGTSTDTLRFSDTNIDQADLAITMDTTGSMAGEIANLRQGFSARIIPSVRRVIPDVAFSVSSFEDFPVSPFGDSQAGDLPFRLGTRVTTNSTAAQNAINALQTRNGADFPESGQVSLHRLATGQALSWPGGRLGAFDATLNRIPGVADGSIGGAGFRQDALPIVVELTDAVSHTWRDYPSTIATATTGAVKDALSAIGARVVTVSGGGRPFNDLLCGGNLGTFFGDVEAGRPDADWFELRGVQAGDLVQIDVQAQAFGSALDPVVGLARGATMVVVNDDAASNTLDSRIQTVLTGTGPFYVAVTSFGDSAFNGTGQQTAGHYLVTVSVNSATGFHIPTPTECRPDDSGSRTGATPLVPFAQAAAPTNATTCQSTCDQRLGGVHPFFADFTFPYEIAEETGAVVPTCAWSVYGARPLACPVGTCCTGRGGAGVAPNAAGQCPLAFEISETGAGLDLAMVSGIEALVRFSPFDLTTTVRGDPNAAGGVDTTCFIQSVVPVRATPPNTCAPAPTIADRLPPAGVNDTWVGAVPGTRLEFDVLARNDDGQGGACVGRGPSPQLFRAYIDVVADGVTVVDTRQVIIIVPPRPPGGSN